MTVLSITFALILGGNDLDQMKVPTYIQSEDLSSTVSAIETESVFTPELVTDEAELTKQVRSGKYEFGLILDENDFQIIVGIDSPNVSLLEQSIRNIYIQQEQYKLLETRSEEHTSELQSRGHLVCRLLLE